MKDRPFALIGVDTDESLDKLKTVMKENGITWRNTWANPKAKDGLPKQWSIRGYPTVMLLDAKGVIRSKHIGVEEAELMKEIEDLVKEAEASAKPAK